MDSLSSADSHEGLSASLLRQAQSATFGSDIDKAWKQTPSALQMAIGHRWLTSS